MKQCSRCEQLKSFNEFNKSRKSKKDGLASYCKKCNIENWNKWYGSNKERKKAYDKAYSETHRKEQAAYKKMWADKYPEKILYFSRKSQLKKRFGITVEFKLEAREKQNNRCAICNNKFLTDWDCKVDHDHKTGKIRELLCNRCNFMLGRVDDSIEVLTSMIEYLRKHSSLIPISATQ